jgi:Zn-dependent peptidase ImmA (M78 family)
MSKGGKRGARREAQELLKRFGLRTPPIPVERLAKELGATLQLAQLDDELSGFVYVEDAVPVIGVNSRHHSHRQRFTIAHEIGHLQLHRDKISDAVHVDKGFRILRRDQTSAAGVEQMEIEANAFAAELLMPEELLHGEIKGPVDVDDDGRVTTLARRYKVSPAAMRNRLLGLFE